MHRRTGPHCLTLRHQKDGLNWFKKPKPAKKSQTRGRISIKKIRNLENPNLYQFRQYPPGAPNEKMLLRVSGSERRFYVISYVSFLGDSKDYF